MPFFILKISIKGGGEVEYQIIDTRKEGSNMYRVTINNYFTVLQKSGKVTSTVLRHFSDKDVAEEFASVHNSNFSTATVSEVPDSEAVDNVIYNSEED